MKLTVTTFNDGLFTLEVPSDIEIENLKAYCEVESGVPADQVNLLWNGVPLSDGKKTAAHYGIAEGDMLFLQQRQAGSSAHSAPAPTRFPLVDFSGIQVPGSSAGPSSRVPGSTAGPSRVPNFSAGRPPQPSSLTDAMDPNTIRELLLSQPDEVALLKQRNPPLAEALVSGDPNKFAAVFAEQTAEKQRRDRERQALFSGNPFDPEVQRKIAEEIQEANVNANMEAAMEFSPESFGQVHMLYVKCRVNGHDVKAFVDSGAQMTIMSKQCAERCHISKLIDKRWSGLAKGVGVQRILGRVHICNIEIQGTHLPCSFSILEEQPMDMLLGLDMLKRHQCCLDLKRNVLMIGTTATETPFLSEADLPQYARLNQPISAEDHDRDMAELLVQESLKASTSAAGSSNASSSQAFPQDKLDKLIASGFSREQAIDALTKSNGDADLALMQLLTSKLQAPK